MTKLNWRLIFCLLFGHRWRIQKSGYEKCIRCNKTGTKKHRTFTVGQRFETHGGILEIESVTDEGVRFTLDYLMIKNTFGIEFEKAVENIENGRWREIKPARIS